jgi:hypothetical protein
MGRWTKGRVEHTALKGSATEAPDTDAKLELITRSYAEVLDATKHQDDKVGRVLTSVAFLTAATLALAALASASFLVRRFAVSPFVLPLGLIALVVFLVGVVFTVMLLLTSLATPLRLPGLVTSKRRRPVAWVKGIPGSQLYFYEIAGLSGDEWETKWSASAEELKKERLDSLIVETRNLADRTNTKYDRTTEAAALLSLSLLAFALAVIFVAIAADSPGARPIHLSTFDRAIIGVVIGGYCCLQLIARIRYARQSIDDTEPDDDTSRVKYRLWGDRLFALLLPILLIVVVIGSSGWNLSAWIELTAILGTATIGSYWLATSPDRHKRSGVIWLYRGMMIILTAALISLAAVSAANGWYAGQLGAACLAVLILITIWVLGPTLILTARRRGMRRRRTGQQRRETSAETGSEAGP